MQPSEHVTMRSAVRRALRNSRNSSGGLRKKAKTFGETMQQEATRKGCSPCQRAWKVYLATMNSIGG